MKTSWKKRLAVALGFTTLLLTLAGCQGGGEKPETTPADTGGTSTPAPEVNQGGGDTTGGKVKIVMDNNSTDQYIALFNQIGSDLGIEVELVVAPGDYEQFLQTQLQSSEKPDLFKLNSQYLTSFVKDGLTTDLNGYFSGSWKETLGTDWDLLTKGTFDQNRREADDVTKRTNDQSSPLWAIPFDSGCQSFGVNRGVINDTPALSDKVDELVASGAIPCKPWEVGMDGQVAAYTYSEFEALLVGLQEVIDAGNLEGSAASLQYAFQGGDSLKLMAYSAGGSFLSADSSTVTLTDEGVIGSAFFIKNGINKGYIDSMQDGGEGWNNWVSGMYLVDANTGTWEYGTYLENGMDVNMMPIPVPDGADRNQWVSGQTGSCMVLRAGSENEEAAAAVMCAFISRASEDFQLENAMNTPLYDDSWDAYINNNEPGEGYFPYDENTKNIYNEIISGAHGRVQETYFTVGRSWWQSFMNDYMNLFCYDTSIETEQDVIDWFAAQEAGIQALLDQGT